MSVDLERLARLEAEYDELLAAEYAGAPGPVLAEAVERTGRVRNKHAALDLKVTGAFDASKQWMANGSRSAAAWMITKGHERKGAPQRRVRLARALRSMPHTERALAAGQITVDHVDLLSECNTDDLAEVFADSERRLVDKAATLRFAGFAQELRYWRDIVDPDGADRSADEKLADRHWHASKSLDDMVRGDGWLDPVGGSIYLTELGRLEGRLFDQDWVEALERLGEGNVCADNLRRTSAQRRADAQVLMAERSASMTAAGTAFRPMLNVVMDWATFCAELARKQGRTDVLFPDERVCRLEDGTIITPSQALSLGLAGTIRELVVSEDGVPLHYGRERRFFTGDLRTAIVLAHPYCTHESGCDVPSYRCQIDHIRPFTDGGPTAAVNGDPKCEPHNRHKETVHRTQRVVQRR